ncbi:beta-N-acetylhexosaminidase [Rhizobium sp. KVB221]|uniref:beta-N-acetylhexosaminidase n=1 Tax=Rhizobium setariae TaxID=2801340 RepID=A0A936YKP1_9HYPH|nr:beta-N-acetylhexosaminidase [Rhizobium setariae]MBL0372164.1 beta-N-acetylhexosaminidase [Rhizobium setariae]
MPTTRPSALQLETSWQPAANGSPPAYTLSLKNRSSRPLSRFRLCVSGPGRVDPSVEIDGGTVGERLSNFTAFLPPEGFELATGATWTVSVHALSWPLSHWTDGANSAYVEFDDGSTLSLPVSPTRLIGNNAPLKRGVEAYPVPDVPPAPVSIVPWPNHVSVSGRRPTPAGFALTATDPKAVAAAGAFTDLVDLLFAVEGMVRPSSEGGMPVALRVKNGLASEAYEMDFSEAGISISASTQTGLFYGLVTLGQIWRGVRLHPHAFKFPLEGQIRDEPAMGWRGLHLDVARQFYASGEIRKLLAILAWNKLNRFHWHLSDDEAWRVEIDAYPALTEIGAWRGHGLPVPPLLGSGPERSGGYYTKATVREIVAFAKDLGIEIVPEIDVPGHCFAMQQALPELRDPAEIGSYYSVQGFPDNCINPAREKTYEVLETIFRELIELFPFKTIHVGADEVPLGAWSGSPQALARLAQLGGPAMAEAHSKRLNVITNTHGADDINGSGTAVLQALFLERIQKFLASQGCVTGGWEEAAHGNVIDKSASYLCGWRNVEVSAALADEGYEMVVCPGQAYYLDMANSPDWDEPGASWAGWSAPEMTYNFDPVAGWSDAQKQKLRGVQACIWSEAMTDRAVFDRLVFPRLSAVAETAWTRPESKSWERFKAFAGLMPVLYDYP